MAVKQRRTRTCMPAERIYKAHRRSRFSGKSSTSVREVTSQLSDFAIGSSGRERRVTRLTTKLLRENRPFRLLDLPPEMRVRVYQEIEVEDLRVSSKHRGTLTSTSKMVYISSQVGEEFINELHRTAPIRAKVVNFNFRDVVTAINKLTPADIRSLKKVPKLPENTQPVPTEQEEASESDTTSSTLAEADGAASSAQDEVEQSEGRRFKVELQITQDHNEDLIACLTRWLNRFDSKEDKTGTNVDFKYTIVDSAQPELGREKVTLPLEDWEVWLQAQQKESHWARPAGQGLDELRKIK